MRRVLVLALLACLPAVALADKAPWSEIDGTVVDAADANLATVAVVKVGEKSLAPCRGGADKSGKDGKTTGSLFDSFGGDRKKVSCVDATRRLKLPPGVHQTTIATTRLAQGGGLATQRFELTAEPCMRYRLVARHEGPGAKRFAVEIAATERIDTCELPGEAAVAAGPVATPAIVTPTGDASSALPATNGAASGSPQR